VDFAVELSFNTILEYDSSMPSTSKPKKVKTMLRLQILNSSWEYCVWGDKV